MKGLLKILLVLILLTLALVACGKPGILSVLSPQYEYCAEVQDSTVEAYYCQGKIGYPKEVAVVFTVEEDSGMPRINFILPMDWLLQPDGQPIDIDTSGVDNCAEEEAKGRLCITEAIEILEEMYIPEVN